MITRAGTHHKAMDTEWSIKAVEEMMAQLIKDRWKRVEGIATEHAKRDIEITTERTRCDAEIGAECEAREREVKL